MYNQSQASMSYKNNSNEDSKQQEKVWHIALILALVGAFYFLKPYISIILLSLLVAHMYFPVHAKILKWLKGRKSLAVSITTVLMIFSLTIPVLIIATVSIKQGVKLADQLGIGELSSNTENVYQVASDISQKINEISFNLIGRDNILSRDDLTGFLQKTLPDLLRTVFDSVVNIIAGIPGLFILLIVFLFLFTGILYNHKKLIDIVHQISPFDQKITAVYLKRIGLMTGAMVRGQLLIATLQGFVSATTLIVLGLGDYYLFFAFLFTFLSLIPLGSGIFTIPAGILAILLGNVGSGVIILLIHFLLVTNIDNLRPKLVPKDARLPAGLTILAAFSGVAYFGLLGVIYGPIIMIVITTTIEMYALQKNRPNSTV